MLELIRREKPQVIVSGHTHKPCFEQWGDVSLFNPGSAGDGRGRRRSVGILRCDERGISVKHVPL